MKEKTKKPLNDIKSQVYETALAFMRFRRWDSLKLKCVDQQAIYKNFPIRRTDIHRSLRELVEEGKLLVVKDGNKKLYLSVENHNPPFLDDCPCKTRKSIPKKDYKQAVDLARHYGRLSLEDLSWCPGNTDVGIIHRMIQEKIIRKSTPNNYVYRGEDTK